MAENNNPSPISQPGIARATPEKITGDPEPDMDVLEWAKKHIEIPEMWAQLSGLPVQEIEPKKRIRNRSSPKTMPKADHVLPDKPEEQDTSREDNTTTSGTRLVERKTEIIGTGYPGKNESRQVLAERANSAIFERHDQEMIRLRLMIDELRFRLDDMEAGRRPR